MQETDAPTPTYGPALLANLRAESNFEEAIVVGLPIYAKALTKYRHMRAENKIDKNMPLNFNNLASVDNIKALLKGNEFSVSIDPVDGTTKLKALEPKDTLSTVNTVNTVNQNSAAPYITINHN